jgi:transposase InsO family protein
MQFHASHALGLRQRYALVVAIEGGMTLRAAAAAFSVAPATAHRWWHRWRAASEAERCSRSCLLDRSSRPRRSPRQLTAAEEEPILRARRETNLGPGRLAGIVRRARSTVWKVLHRHGLSRRRRGERQSYRRYEWSRPGALLHMDVKRLARFRRPGHAVTGVRDMSWAERRAGVGYDYLHVVIDDHSRLAYVELHRREDKHTNALTLERAVAFFAELGLSPPEAVMTDNALVYVRSRPFRALLARLGARHITPPPYTPRWNGKAERFIQTLQNEWAYAHRYPSSTARAKSQRSFLRYYNRQRPHSSLADRPPISRVHNLHGQDT